MNLEIEKAATGRLSRTTLGVFYLSIVIFIIFKIVAVASIPVIGHDDGITLLSISGEQGVYARLSDMGIVNDWLPANIFKDFTSASGSLDFSLIQDDLNNYDIHPPLYFWLLATWSRAFPGVVDAYFYLNVVLVLVSIFVFYKTLRLRFSAELSSVMTVSFMFLPALITSNISIRQYELNMLASSCLLFSTSYLIFSPSSLTRNLFSAIAIAISILMGLMSHAQFVLLVCAVIGAMAFSQCARPKLVVTIFASTTAFILFFFVNTGFIDAFLRHRNQLQEPDVSEFLGRIKNIVLKSSDIFPISGPAAFFLVAVIVLYGLRRATASQKGKTNLAALDKYWVLSGISVFLIYTLFYAAMQGPSHAYGGRYLLPILPWFAASALTLLLLLSKKYALQSVSLISLFLFLSATHEYIERIPDRLNDRQVLRSTMSEANSVYVANSARGYASPIFPLLSENSKVFLYGHSLNDEVLQAAYADLRKGDIIYVRRGYRISSMEAERQLSLLRDSFRLVELPFPGLYVLR